MKVLMLITRAELGGAQCHVVDLLEGLQGKFELHLGTGEEGYLTEAARRLRVPAHIIPDLVQPMSPIRDYRAVRQVKRLIEELKPDLVHAHTSKAGIIGRLAAAWTGTPAIFTAHTWCFAEGTSWKWKLIGTPIERLAARWSSAIINVSEANRQLALQRGVRSGGAMLTVHNGIADTAHRASVGGCDAPAVVMVARFAPQKAQAALLEAASGIDLPFRIVFVGDGPTRPALEQMSERLGLAKKVEFLGERRDVARILAASQIFALPTNWEGFPLSILEAMRAGLPVVVSDVGGVKEAVLDGETGLLSAAGDIGGFREGLRRLIEDASLRVRLGHAGRARFEREFTVNGMLQKTAMVYQRCAGSAALVPASVASDILTPQ